MQNNRRLSVRKRSAGPRQGVAAKYSGTITGQSERVSRVGGNGAGDVAILHTPRGQRRGYGRHEGAIKQTRPLAIHDR